MQGDGDILAGKPCPLRPRLVDAHDQLFGARTPVVTDVDDPGDARHLRLYLVGQGKDIVGGFAGDAHLHRRGHRRSQQQRRNLSGDVGEIVVNEAVESGNKLAVHLPAVGDIEQQVDIFRALRLHIQGEIKSRRPGADEGGEIDDPVPAYLTGVIISRHHAVADKRFGLGDHCLGFADRGAHRQAQLGVHHRLVVGREEDVGDQRQQLHRSEEDHQNPGDRQQGMLQQGDQHPAVAAIEFAVETFALLMLFNLDEQHAEQRGHGQGQQPGAEQGDSDHLEDRRGVFAGGGFRQVDRQKGCGGGQGGGEQGDAQFFGGVDRRLHRGLAFFHLHHDRF